MAFWKPGTQAPGSSLDRASELDQTLTLTAALVPSSHLPIAAHRHRLLYAIEHFPVTILVANTGCGKTTQLPQYLYEAGWAPAGKVIACTQPRRVAATSVAARVAHEQHTTLGDLVGYSIRFEDLSDKYRTRILHLTDGVLFRETLRDPLLSRFSVIIIDEVHERSVHTDLLLGLLKKIHRKRPELRIVISSATLDAEFFFNYFNELDFSNPKNSDDNTATILTLEGRMYPVDIAYLSDPTPDYVRTAADTVWAWHTRTSLPGDVLVFLTGRDDIERCIQELAEHMTGLPSSAPRLLLLPLHAGLSADMQAEVFAPAPRGTRKVIVSTNVAEASVTIDGIAAVVDCGFVKIRTYDPRAARSALSTVQASASSITQRTGRAGRTAPGVCFRLWCQTADDKRPTVTPPELTRTDLTTPVLQLAALGIANLQRFPWPTPPPAESVLRALEGLVAADMIEAPHPEADRGKTEAPGSLKEGVGLYLTPVGAQVAEMPLEVGLARMLFMAALTGCADEVLSIAAMVAVQDVWVSSQGEAAAYAELERRKFTAQEGDHLTLLNVYNGFVRSGKTSGWARSHYLNFRALSRAVSIRSQLVKYMKRFKLEIKSCQGDAVKVRKCLAAGYWRNGARWMADGTYRSVRGGEVLHVHPTSVLFTRKPRSGWVVFHEMEETTKTQIRVLTEIEADW
ncbi:pre-mRNA splicing factor [Fistulina hepatica ATCC 64428]|nr:pre-mRNA splicing factor [Fistulina hepatica ATCC 64428]